MKGRNSRRIVGLARGLMVLLSEITPLIITILAILVVWELGVKALDIQEMILPAPSAIINRGIIEMIIGRETALLRKYPFIFHFYTTMYRTLFAWSTAVAVGIAAGISMGLFLKIKRAIYPLFTAIAPLPKLSLLPLFMIWFGIGDTPLILCAIITCFFPVMINSLSGITGIDSTLVKAAKNLGAGRKDIIRRVVLPGALPSLFSGIKIAIGSAIVMIIAGELYISRTGLGYLIDESGRIYATALMFGVLIIISLVSIVLFRILDFVERILIPWKGRITEIP